MCCLRGWGAGWFGGWRDEPKADQKDMSQVRLTSFDQLFWLYTIVARHYLTNQICLDTNVLQAWITLAQLKPKVAAVLFVFQMHYTKYCKEMLTTAAVEQVHLSLDFSFAEGYALHSTRLPSVWPGFECWRRRHAWVEFVVESRHCRWRTTLGYATTKSLHYSFICLFLYFFMYLFVDYFPTDLYHYYARSEGWHQFQRPSKKVFKKEKNPFSVIPRINLTLFFYVW